MPHIEPVDALHQSTLSAVDFFMAKLQYEAMPHQLHGIKDKDSVLIVDVRDKASYDKEHIEGAASLPLEELAGRMRELPRDKTIVTYCWTVTCPLASKAALELAHRGYKVQELFGGIEAWKKSGFEVEGSGRARA